MSDQPATVEGDTTHHVEVHLSPGRLRKWTGAIRSAREFDQKIIDQERVELPGGTEVEARLCAATKYGGAYVRIVLMGGDSDTDSLLQSHAVYRLGSDTEHKIGAMGGTFYSVSIGTDADRCEDPLERETASSYLHQSAIGKTVRER